MFKLAHHINVFSMIELIAPYIFQSPFLFLFYFSIESAFYLLSLLLIRHRMETQVFFRKSKGHGTWKLTFNAKSKIQDI